MEWNRRRVLVTGGACFIGSRLVDALVERGANVRVADDLSSGKLENIRSHVASGRVEFVHEDLRQAEVAERVVQGMSVISTWPLSTAGVATWTGIRQPARPTCCWMGWCSPPAAERVSTRWSTIPQVSAILERMLTER